jgi:tRNA A-37 threonylcarbamoyl transferase component Bud32
MDAGGVLVLPCLGGTTLASVLEDRDLAPAVCARALELAARALAAFHRAGFTHGDAMAENVLIDLDAGTARWFDFETVHESSRPPAWRRADDLRALLSTCVVRTDAAMCEDVLAHILDAYDDPMVIRDVREHFMTVWRPALVFHLAQAPLTDDRFREIGRLLRRSLHEQTSDGLQEIRKSGA